MCRPSTGRGPLRGVPLLYSRPAAISGSHTASRGGAPQITAGRLLTPIDARFSSKLRRCSGLRRVATDAAPYGGRIRIEMERESGGAAGGR